MGIIAGIFDGEPWLNDLVSDGEGPGLCFIEPRAYVACVGSNIGCVSQGIRHLKHLTNYEK